MDSTSAMMGIALPNRPMTLSDVSTCEALENHSITETSMQPMHAPYARLSRYTARTPMRNSSVDPDAEKSGLSAAMTSTSGNCQSAVRALALSPRRYTL